MTLAGTRQAPCGAVGKVLGLLEPPFFICNLLHEIK